MKVLLIFSLLFIWSCSEQIKLGKNYLIKKVKNQDYLYYDDDTLTVFQDTPVQQVLKVFTLPAKYRSLEYIDSSVAQIKIGRIENLSSKDNDICYFIEKTKVGKIKRWQIELPGKDPAGFIEWKLGWWITNQGKDSFLTISFRHLEHSDSPYFYEDIQLSGLQVWDLKNQVCMAGFHPLDISVEHGDIIKGDYDEEVGGIPTIGTIAYRNSYRHDIQFSDSGIQFIQLENTFDYDSAEDEELDQYIDSFEIEYRKDLIRSNSARIIEYKLLRK